MAISKFDLLFDLVTWFRDLIFCQCYLQEPVLNTDVDQVWWWYIKAFVSYAWQNRQTNRQTNILAEIENFGK